MQKRDYAMSHCDLFTECWTYGQRREVLVPVHNLRFWRTRKLLSSSVSQYSILVLKIIILKMTEYEFKVFLRVLIREVRITSLENIRKVPNEPL